MYFVNTRQEETSRKTPPASAALINMQLRPATTALSAQQYSSTLLITVFKAAVYAAEKK